MATTTVLEAEHWTAGQSQPEATVNESFNVFDAAAAGTITVNASADADQTLVTTGAKPQQWMYKRVILTDTSALWTGAHNVIVPTNAKDYVFTNNASTGFDATIKTAAGTGVACPYGESIFVRCDGTNVVQDVVQSLTSAALNQPVINGYTEVYASVSVTSSSTVLDMDVANVFEITLTANASVTFTNVASATGRAVTATIFVTQDGTGGRSMNVVSAIYASGGASTPSQGASERDLWTFITRNGGDTWYGMPAGQTFK